MHVSGRMMVGPRRQRLASCLAVLLTSAHTFSAHVWIGSPVASSQKSVKFVNGMCTVPNEPTVGDKLALYPVAKNLPPGGFAVPKEILYPV